MIKDYEIEVEKRNRDLLISKGALKDNVRMKTSFHIFN